jgi:5'-nucleotidase
VKPYTLLVALCLLAGMTLTAGGCANASTKKPSYTKKRTTDPLDIAPAPPPAIATSASTSSESYNSAAYQPAPAPQPVVYDTVPAPAPVASFTTTPAATATDITPAASAGGRYKVKSGDTLFSIAKTQYGDGKQWKRIASANPGLTPASLKAGQTITIP